MKENIHFLKTFELLRMLKGEQSMESTTIYDQSIMRATSPAQVS